MRARGRLLACVAIVLPVHVGLMAALLRAPASGARRPVPHQTAAVRLLVVGPFVEPQAAAPQRPPATTESAKAPSRVPSAPPQGHVTATPEPLAVETRSALAPERQASAPPAPQEPTIAPAHDFLSSAQVDSIAIAFPSPDISSLSGLSWSGLPIRLRLFVDASGRCVDVQFLRASEDAGTLERLRQMFLATHFLPARRGGADVDAYRDIELDVSDVK